MSRKSTGVNNNNNNVNNGSITCNALRVDHVSDWASQSSHLVTMLARIRTISFISKMKWANSRFTCVNVKKIKTNFHSNSSVTHHDTLSFLWKASTHPPTSTPQPHPQWHAVITSASFIKSLQCRHHLVTPWGDSEKLKCLSCASD